MGMSCSLKLGGEGDEAGLFGGGGGSGLGRAGGLGVPAMVVRVVLVGV